MNSQASNNQELKAALEALHMDGVHNEALTDCLAFVNLPISALEGFLDSNLWVGEDFEFESDEHKLYYIALGQIEQHLVSKSLIYND